jgi:hypothetical protein
LEDQQLEVSILCFVLRDDGWFLELATSSMCHFKGRAKSVRPVGTVFAIALVIMVAKAIETTLLVHELEGCEFVRE